MPAPFDSAHGVLRLSKGQRPTLPHSFPCIPSAVWSLTSVRNGNGC